MTQILKTLNDRLTNAGDRTKYGMSVVLLVIAFMVIMFVINIRTSSYENSCHWIYDWVLYEYVCRYDWVYPDGSKCRCQKTEIRYVKPLCE